MECREARQALAGEAETREAIEAARLHVASCSACQARADQLAAAILSGAEEELSCAECLVRLDAHAAVVLNEGDGLELPDADPLLARHLQSCPECEEAWLLLAAGLAGLRNDSLPEPRAWPSFDLGFARDTEAAPARAPAAGWWQRARAALARALPPSGLEGWQRAWRAPAWQQLSRGSLALLALVITLGFAWLLLLDPSLPEPIDRLSPFGQPTATLTGAEVSATQTMAVQMGIDWVDAAEPGATRTVTPRSGRGTPPGRPAVPGASPSATRFDATEAASEGDARPDPDRDRPGGQDRPPTATAIDPSLLITGTLQPRRSIPYPPPPTRTRDPYPGPEDPEPTPTPTPMPMPMPTPTPEASGPEPTAAPEPSASPGAAP